MFSSGDDSFDVDDETFLNAAKTIEESLVQKPIQKQTTSSWAAAAHEPKPHPHPILRSPGLGAHPTPDTSQGRKFSANLRDPLGLNRTLLNNVSNTNQTEPLQSNARTAANKLDRERVDNFSNSEKDRLSSAIQNKSTIKKFNFKASFGKRPKFDHVNAANDVEETVSGDVPQRPSTSGSALANCDKFTNLSSGFSAKCKDSDRSQAVSAGSVKQVDHKQTSPAPNPGAFKQKVGSDSKTCVSDSIKDLFQVGDDWDCDLDLSGLNCDGAPDWIPSTGPAPHQSSPKSGANGRNTNSELGSSSMPSEHFSPKVPCSPLAVQVDAESPSNINQDRNNRNDQESCFKTPVHTRNHRLTSGSSVSKDRFVSRNDEPAPGPSPSLGLSENGARASTSSGVSVQLRGASLSGLQTPTTLRRPALNTDSHTPTTVGCQGRPGLHTPLSQGHRHIQDLHTPEYQGTSRTPVSHKDTRLSSATVTSKLSESPASRSGASLVETPSSSTASLASSKRKRKFPGPAGVLPKLKPGLSLNDMNVFKPKSPRVNGSMKQVVPDSQVTSTQSAEDRFTDGPWHRMAEDLEPQAQAILQDYSISSILRKAVRRELPRSKVPVLCVILDQISVQNAEASVVLRDPTGVMKGTIHRHVVKEYPDDMQTGTVLVLRQVGVFSPSGRNYYLNITPNNLVRIYSKDQSSQEVSAKRIAAFSSEDFKVPDPLPQTPGIHRTSPFPRGVMSRIPQRPHGPQKQLYSAGRPSVPSPRFQRPPGPYRQINSSSAGRSNFTGQDLRPRWGSSPSGGSAIHRPAVAITQPVLRSLNNNNNSFSVRLATSRNTLRSSPSTGAVVPSGDRGSDLPTSGTGQILDAGGGTVAGNIQNKNHGNTQLMDNLWQDDQLDDLLSDLGDDVLSEF